MSEKENDLHFGFKEYSKAIKDTLNDSFDDDKRSLVVGIFGEWGSGKSKLLEEIKNDFANDEKVIPVWFNAWRFEKEEHIVIPMLKSAFYEIANNKTFLDKLGNNSIKTLKALFSLSYSLTKGVANSFTFKDINGVEMNTKELTKEIDNIPTNIGNIFNDDTFQYESMYYNFHQILGSMTKDAKLLFLIDDLDRCLPENSLKVLESIKLFLDIPGCSFVLALDDDVIEKGVAHHYRDYEFVNKSNHKNESIIPPISGSEYLEKMINIPFKLPKLSLDDIEGFLKKYLDSKKEKDIIDIFSQAVPPIPRKLIRVAELFKTKQKLMSSLSLSYDDKVLAKFVILEILAPEIYRYGAGEFDSFYEYLYEWKDKCDNLSNIDKIDNFIKDGKSAEYLKDEQKKLLELIKRLKNKRGRFILDNVIDNLPFKQYEIYLTFVESKEIIYQDTLNNHYVNDDTAFIENILSGDTRAISSAFRDEKFKLGEDGIPKNIIDKLLEEENKLTFEFFTLVKDYLNDEDFKQLIKASNILNKSTKGDTK